MSTYISVIFSKVIKTKVKPVQSADYGTFPKYLSAEKHVPPILHTSSSLLGGCSKTKILQKIIDSTMVQRFVFSIYSRYFKVKVSSRTAPYFRF